MGILSNQAAIITGGGSGLGRAVALLFAEHGAKVVLCGRRKAKLDEVVQQIVQSGGTAIPVQADVSLEADVGNVIRQAVTAFGKIDILINNAAVFESALVAETPLREWNQQLAVNLTGPFLMTKATLPVMRLRKFGTIINITSSLASNGAGGFAAYSASKAGLESLTRSVAEEESRYNIVANLFDPGTIRTEMHATGRDPASVAPDLLELASSNQRRIGGRLFVFGSRPW